MHVTTINTVASYLSGTDGVSLVSLALASGTGTRELDGSPGYTTGASYYAVQDVTVAGVRFWWLRSATTVTDTITAGLWVGGSLLASKMVSVSNDGGVEAWFDAPVTVPGGQAFEVSYYDAGNQQCRCPTGSSPFPVPDLYSGKALAVGRGLVLANGYRFTAGNAYPGNALNPASAIFYPAEPILLGETKRVPRTIWVEGDSISAGLGLTFNFAQLWTLTAGSQVRNEAVSGRTLVSTPQTGSNNIADNLTNLISGYNANAPREIIIFAGTNDIYYGADGLTTLSRLWGVVNTIRAACPNDRIWVVTPIARANWSGSPTYSGSDTPYNAALTAYAAGIRSGAAAHGVRVIDAAAEPRFGDATNTAYYAADKCHPVFAGHKVLAWLIRLALGL